MALLRWDLLISLRQARAGLGQTWAIADVIRIVSQYLSHKQSIHANLNHLLLLETMTTVSWFIPAAVWYQISENKRNYELFHLLDLVSFHKIWAKIIITLFVLCHVKINENLWFYRSPSINSLLNDYYIMFQHLSLDTNIRIKTFFIRILFLYNLDSESLTDTVFFILSKTYQTFSKCICVKLQMFCMSLLCTMVIKVTKRI